MERDISFGEVDAGPGPFADLIDLFIEEEKARVQDETDYEERQGTLNALQMCEEMRDGEVTDFELALVTMQQVSHDKKAGYLSREVPYEEFRVHTVATNHLYGFYNILRAAHYDWHGKFYGQDTFQFTNKDGRYDPSKIDQEATDRYRNLAEKLALRREDLPI
jgi:hypothetical protein